MSYFPESIQQRFKLYLKTKGYAFTPQRRKVLHQVLSNESHFDLESLIHQIDSENLKASRATVYRTITHLENAGIVRKVHMHQGRAYYEITPGRQRHEHLVCRNCGKVIEFSHRSFERQIESIAQNHGFRVSGHSVEIFGICRECIRRDISDALGYSAQSTTNSMKPT